MAELWDSISGAKGQTYKRYVVRPTMFKQIRKFSGKRVLEVGCGNGYLGPIFIRNGVRSVLMMDISQENLAIAKRRNSSDRATFLKHDATKKWPLKSRSFDIVYSDMMLNEIRNIATPINEAYRVLKKGGQFIVAVTHPAWDLFEFAKKKFSGSSETIPEAGPYFERKYNHFVMSTNSLGAKFSEQYRRSFLVEHYQRPLSDYFNQFVIAGFCVKKIEEPQIPERVLKQFPRYRAMNLHPVGLIFSCQRI